VCRIGMSELAEERASLEKERQWFLKHMEKVMDGVATRLSGVASPWLTAPSSATDDAVSPQATAAGPAVTKSPQLSVDDILAQARAPKKSVGDGPSGTASPARSMKKEKKAATEDEQEKTISFRSTDQMLQGFVVLQGHSCVEAELTVQFKNPHRGVSGSAELEIRPSRPWRLVQLQNCAHLVFRCVDNLRRGKLAEALDELRLAQEQLMQPWSRLFPADSRVFHPRLPADLLVELCVLDQAYLQIQVLLVRAVSPGKAPLVVPLFLAKQKVGDVIGLGQSKMCEVLEVSSVQCPLSSVASVAADLTKCLAELSELQRNWICLN
jgi:hypothetical protein